MPKISELPSSDLITGAEAVAVVQDGVTKQTLVKDLRPYKLYTALLTQSKTDAPTAVVLENTIGNIVWSYYSVGEYIGTLTGAFTPNKTAGFLGSDFISISSGGRLSNNNGDIDTVNVQTWDITNNPSDDILLSTFIEIRVYN